MAGFGWMGFNEDPAICGVWTGRMGRMCWVEGKVLALTLSCSHFGPGRLAVLLSTKFRLGSLDSVVPPASSVESLLSGSTAPAWPVLSGLTFLSFIAIFS